MSSAGIIGLVAAGFLLLLAEVFLPGGVLGGLGGLLVLAGVLCGFVFRGPSWGLTLLMAACVFGLAGFWLWVKLFPRTPMGRRLMLDKDAHDWKGTDPDRQALLGKEGVAHTTLRPAGTALIDGIRVDVVTRGELIEARTRIRVLAVEGNRVVVTAAE